MLLVEADGAGVIGVDVKVEAAWRDAFGLIDQRGRDTAAPGFRRYDDLIEIERAGIDGDKPDQTPCGSRPP